MKEIHQMYPVYLNAVPGREKERSAAATVPEAEKTPCNVKLKGAQDAAKEGKDVG